MVEAAKSEKPQLHQSQIVTFTNCGMQYYFSSVEGKRRPPGVALITGTAVHQAVEDDLRNKIATGELLPAEQVADIASDTVKREWDRGEGVSLTEDELEEGAGATRGSTIDAAVRLAQLHHTELAPTLQPKAVERKFKLSLDGYGVDLAGTIDIQEPTRLRDTKTYARTPGQDEVDRSIQLTMYSMAIKALDGVAPESVHLDVLVKNKKPKLVVLNSERRRDDYLTLLKRVEIIVGAIEAGVFIPTTPDNWRCSEKWCGFFNECPFGSRRRVQAHVRKAA